MQNSNIFQNTLYQQRKTRYGKCYLMSELTKSFDAEKLISDKKENIKSIEIFFFQHFQKFDFRQKKPLLNTKPTLFLLKTEQSEQIKR